MRQAQIGYDDRMQFQPETCHKTIRSPWGSLTLAANPKGLSGVWFENQKHFPNTHAWTLSNQHPTLLQAEQILGNYFDQKWPPASSARKALQNIALDLSAGTEFQKAVWHALMSIPMGQTCSYGQLAAAIGRPMAVRAVGTSVGRNVLVDAEASLSDWSDSGSVKAGATIKAARAWNQRRTAR